jgi:hypothetical protein
MATAADFRGSRKDVALVLAGAPRTLHEASKALGKPTSSIYRLVQRMLADGLLLADSDPPTRGTLYRLNPEVRAALDAALAHDQPIGRVQEGQRLLLVDGDEGLLALQRVLVDPRFSGCVAWAAELDGTAGMLLALAPEAARLPAERLIVALERAGFRCIERRAGELIGADDLRRHAVALLEAADEVS